MEKHEADHPAVRTWRRRLGYRLEFKVCIFQDGHLKRWENFPADRNRVFIADCRGIRIKILESHLETHLDKRYRAPSSDEFFAGQLQPVHKYSGLNVILATFRTAKRTAIPALAASSTSPRNS